MCRANAFNSELGFWNAQTVHMRTSLQVTQLQVRRQLLVADEHTH
jgi:hypothetical protein